MVGRLLAVSIVLIVISQPPPPAPPPTPFTSQTAQWRILDLYAQTNGEWSSVALGDLMAIYAEQDAVAQVVQLMPHTNPRRVEVPALMTIAEQQKSEREWEQLRITLETVLQIDAAEPDANFWLGLLELPATSRLDELVAIPNRRQNHAAQILSVAEDDREIGIRLLQMEEWAFADRFLTQHLERENLDAVAYSYRGYVRDQLGLDGLPDIEQALILEPGLPLGFYMLGLHERLAGNFDDSAQTLLNAFLLDPENPALAAEVAAAHQLINSFDVAEEWFALAVSLAPEDERFIVLQANFYADTRHTEGLAFVEAARAQYPENIDLLTSLGALLTVRRDFNAARESLQVALQLAPDSPRVRFYWAELLQAERDIGGALEHYLYVAGFENPYQEQALDRLTD